MNELKIIQRFITKNDCYKQGRTIKPKGIMVHSTATPGVMALDWPKRWDKPKHEVAVHAFVDDKNVVQLLPWTMRAWHCGRSGNDTHLSFEICEPKDWKTNKVYFHKAWRNAVLFSALMCEEFGLTAADVTSHCEGYKAGIASNHADPMHWFPKFGKDMNMFRKDVAHVLKYGSWGDVNGDGSITVSDIVALRQSIMADNYNPAGDIDGDGRNTVADVVALREQIMGASDVPEKKNPTLKYGSNGEAVKKLQTMLDKLKLYYDKIDGNYGPLTLNAVRTFQTKYGLKVNGEVDSKTWAALEKAVMPGNPYPAPARVLRKGCNGDDVKWLQWELKRRGYNLGPKGIDGDYGPDTQKAVILYQKDKKLIVDGAAGPQTQGSLGGVKHGRDIRCCCVCSRRLWHFSEHICSMGGV